MWKSFFKEMEKNAFMAGTALIGGFTAMDIGSQAKEQQNRLKLTPLRQNNQFKLQNPNQYQFEGGKHTSLKNTTSPSSSLYR